MKKNDLNIKGLRQALRRTDETLKYFCKRDPLPLTLRWELMSVSRQMLFLDRSCLHPVVADCCAQDHQGVTTSVSSPTSTNPVNTDLEDMEVCVTPFCPPFIPDWVLGNKADC